MACNSWDKLCRAQRDYPKAKFAESFVQKSLKKTPKNPFLLAWRADLSLQLNQDPKNVALQIQQVWQQPGAYDTRLLAYLYKLLAEATRRSGAAVRCISGLGNENSKAWLSAAKTLSPRERQELWSQMGKAAWREQCWEDFRFAVMQYSKELKDSFVPASVKKDAHFTQILATQLAAEQQSQLPDGGLKSQIQFDLARRLTKQAYEASPDEPIACKDIRDLRFMGEIFARQGKCDELINLWNNPPATLKDLMATHQADLRNMRIRLSRQSQNWSLLESECLATIENAMAQVAADPDSKALWELCAWNNDIWVHLLSALRINRSMDEGNKIVSDILDRGFGTELQTKDRALRLTYMTLRKFIGASLTNDCKTFWQHHSTLPSCFKDMRQFVEALTSAGDKAQFFEYFNNEVTPDQDKFREKDWQIHCQNVSKLTYLITTSVADQNWLGYRPRVLEHILSGACKFGDFLDPSSPAGYMAIYTLLRLHHGAMRNDESVHPFGNTPNSRLLLQATMLARHLVACDKDKQDRPRALLAARLHLNLGLGKSAFQMYSYTKCKEMLVHTLSPYVLSRISLTHPFGAQGYRGFSAEEELGKAIGTMERMESKTEETIYPDLSALPWDQAIGLLSLRQKLKSSLTKHICNVERRRIARLKGEPVDQLPTLDRQSFQDVVDNVDTSVFPDYGHSQGAGPVPFIMPNMVPNLPCIIEGYSIWEASSRVLYKETQTGGNVDSWVDAVATPADGYQSENNMTVAELSAERMWVYINTVVGLMSSQDHNIDILTTTAKQLSEDLHAMRLAMEKLRMPGATNLKPEDEPTMFHENMLIYCYTKLEVLRALSKMVDHLREKVVGPKCSHPMKAKLPKNWVHEIESETKICYEAIRDVVNSYIKLIEQKGEAAIKAQVRWGNTGEILRGVMNDEDVESYASEYVDSALQAWKGVLQVKLK